MRNDAPCSPGPRRRSGRSLLFSLGLAAGGSLLASLVLAQTPAGTQTPETRPGGTAERRGGPRGPGRGGGERAGGGIFRTEVPAHPVDLILGRPTSSAITLSVLADEDGEASVAYGPRTGAYTGQSPRKQLRKGEPAEFRLTGLQPNTRYYYQLRSRTAGKADLASGPEYSFQTARPAGAPFTFTLQADSHLDGGTDPEVYRNSLAQALASHPDFHIDLGDTFMTDKYPEFRQAAPQYLAQRYYLGLVGHSAPVFLVLGNHDGEEPARGGSGPEAMAGWSNAMRKRYFPNPVPDEFYSGNRTPDPQAGLLQDYYAWTWGDAQFVVLDPFWYSERPRGRSETVNNWNRTLGTEQYGWLKRTLEGSRARFKFVFIHHLVGGETREGRGGAEASRFFEWGGQELSGAAGFAEKRPGWPAPIHDLLVKHGVSIVFHGHDHLYVRQERDGVVYQEVPQPGHAGVDNVRSAEEYGYKSGVLQGSSGILRVSVSPEKTQVEYVRAYPTASEGGERRNGAVTHSYTVKPSK